MEKVALIGGIEFESDPRDPDECYLIDYDGITGWVSGVAVRRDETMRPNAHGAFDAAGYLSARVIPWKGNVLASSEERLTHMCARLTGLLADGSMGRLSVRDETRTLWADVRLAAQTQVKVHPSGLEAEYQIQFWAPDPRRFGETHRFVAGEPVYHYGNFPAEPKISVRALTTMPGYTVVGPGGRSYVVSSALPAGSTDLIDMNSGWLYRNGVLQVGAVSRADVWTIPPGQRVTHSLVPVSGTGELSASVTDAFV